MGFVRDLTGKTAAKSAEKAADVQAESGQLAIEAAQKASKEGQAFLQPFADVGSRALELSSFLANPEEQFAFLQSNPLFQASLDNANTQTQRSAAARGRLTAGDTLEQLSQNTLLAAQPLISQQRQDINNLLNLGTGLAQTQANVAIGQGTNVGNLLTDIGAAQAAGLVGSGNARTQGAQNLLGVGSQLGAGALAGLLSDPRLKTNIKPKGKVNGFNWYEWEWNELASKEFGLEGSSEGVMADEVQKTNPELITVKDGFLTVDYGGIH